MDLDSFMFGLLSALLVSVLILATVTFTLQIRDQRRRRNTFPLWRLNRL